MATAMTTEALAARLEQLLPLARANPEAYRRRVWGWVLLGYGFVALLLLSSLGLMGAVLWFGLVVGLGGLAFKLLLGLGYFVWKILRSLWVKFDPPKGRPLRRAEAAPLYELLGQQARALRAPAVHQVLLTEDFNAAVVQLPRLGMLGWPRNYLLLGLPLLQSLSPAQAAAVVAHELGHLRGGHGRFGAWVYRVNASWEQLVERLDGQGLVHRFTSWYVPHFNAWSHPLRRTDEFEADAAAARLTSPATMAAALCATVVREPALDRHYWDPLTASLTEAPAPPPDAMSRLLAVARTAYLPTDEASTLLRHATEADSNPFSTHPTLGERLAALGQPAAVPELPATTAAEAWLGASLPTLTAELDAAWASTRTTAWHERHQQLQAQRQQLAGLQARYADGQALPDDDAWTLADLTEDHVGGAEALPLFRALLGVPKYDAAARFAVGRILLGQDDAAGLPLLEEAIRQSPGFAGPGLALQQAYHQRRGDYATARQLTARQYRQADVEEAARAERRGVQAGDVLLPHGLSADELAPLLALVQNPANQVAQAWVLRKQLAHFGEERPFFLIVLRPAKTKELRNDTQRAAWSNALANQITLPGDGLVVPLIDQFSWLTRQLYQTSGREVYKAAGTN